MKLSAPLPLLLAAIAVAACGPIYPPERFAPGTAKREQVIAALGQPKRVIKQADGGEVLDFSNQPFSHACYLVTVDAGGTVRRFVDAFTDQHLAGIKRGMTREEVTNQMCQPAARERLRSGEEVWEWELSRPGGNNANMFNAYFLGDRVSRVERRTELSEASAD